MCARLKWRVLQVLAFVLFVVAWVYVILAVCSPPGFGTSWGVVVHYLFLFLLLNVLLPGAVVYAEHKLNHAT
jgi:hypothetical protein